MNPQSADEPAVKAKAIDAVPGTLDFSAKEHELAAEAASLLARIHQQLDEGHARADRLLARLG